VDFPFTVSALLFECFVEQDMSWHRSCRLALNVIVFEWRAIYVFLLTYPLVGFFSVLRSAGLFFGVILFGDQDIYYWVLALLA
jgi:hypothetical protein